MNPPGPVRMVSCPTCKGPSRYAPDNPHRPFCSARCQGVDFGAWASEQYRVAPPAAAEDAEVDPGSSPDRAAGP